MRALVIQHEDPTPAGHVDGWLEDRGADQDLLRIYADERQPAPRDYDLIVSLGSESASYDDSLPWLEREMRLLREAAREGVPVLGICFGGQLLARVLGGRSFKNEHAEIGWLPIRSSDRALIEQGPWFQWHFDTFTPPPAARLIADSPAGPQAYVLGRCLGLQFHPEVTPQLVSSWVAADRDELEREGIDPDDMLEQSHRLGAQSRAAAWRLFDNFLERVAGIPETARGSAAPSADPAR